MDVDVGGGVVGLVVVDVDVEEVVGGEEVVVDVVGVGVVVII